jgi:hypothetical protein
VRRSQTCRQLNIITLHLLLLTKVHRLLLSSIIHRVFRKSFPKTSILAAYLSATMVAQSCRLYAAFNRRHLTP